MAGGEAFTILAILDARDRISSVMERVDATLNQFSGTADRAAESARVAGTAIDESFMQNASGANAAELATANLAAAQTRLRVATMEQAGAERELLSLHQQMAATGGNDAALIDRQAVAYQRLATAEREAAVAANGVRDAQARQAATGDALTGANRRAAGSQTALAGSAGAAGGAMKTATKSMLGVGLAAGAIVYESVKAAASFQTLTTRLVTSANEQSKNLDMVRKGIIAVSNDTGVMANDVAKSMYVVESGGYHGARGLEILRAATEGAKIEGAEFGTVANAVTDVLKDYSDKNYTATQATNALIKGVAYGKTNFQNLSSAMQNVLPLADSYHVKLEDVVGVLANMTAHGMTAARASFNIANAMRNLAVPTGVMTKELKNFGLSSRDVQNSLGTRGLAGTLQWLYSVAQHGAPAIGQTTNEAFKKLTGSATALQVGLLTVGKNTKDVNEAIKGIGAASADNSSDVEGFAATQATLAFQLARAKAAIHNAGIEIGTALLPAITKVAAAAAKFLVPIAGWIEKHQKLTAVILGAGVAMGILAGAIIVIGAVVGALTSMVGLVVLGIIALGAALIYAYNHSQKFREVMQTIGTMLKAAWDATLKAAAATIQWFSNTVLPALQRAISAIFGWFSAHQRNFSDAWNTMLHAVEAAAQWFKANVLDWIQARINDLIAWWRSHSEEIEQVWKAMWAVISTAAKVWWDAFKGLLSIVLSGWKTTWGLIKDTLILAWTSIKDTVTLAMHTLLNVIAVILDLITGHWSKAWKDTKKLVSQGIHDVIQIIKDLTSNFGTLLYDAGRNVVKGLANGIKSMAGVAKSAIKDVVSGISGFLPHSPAKEGPLSGSGSPELSGGTITSMIAKGILSGKGTVKTAMTQVTGSALQGLAGGPGNVGVGTLLGAGVTLPGIARGGGGGPITIIQIDFKGAQVIGEQAMDQLADRIGRRVATRILPSGGVKIRM